MVDYSVDYGQTLSPFSALLRSLMPCFAYLDVPSVIRSRKREGGTYISVGCVSFALEVWLGSQFERLKLEPILVGKGQCV